MGSLMLRDTESLGENQRRDKTCYPYGPLRSFDREEDVGWGTVRAYNLNAAAWCVVRCWYYTSLLLR